MSSYTGIINSKNGPIFGPGGLKTRSWKTRDGQKCSVGKRRTGKRGTKLQAWKTLKRHVWKAK